MASTLGSSTAFTTGREASSGLVVVLGADDETVRRADGDQRLGHGGHERDDAGCGDRARCEGARRRQRQHPRPAARGHRARSLRRGRMPPQGQWPRAARSCAVEADSRVRPRLSEPSQQRVGGPRAPIREREHVGELNHRPPPSARLPAHHGHGGHALQREDEEDEQRNRRAQVQITLKRCLKLEGLILRVFPPRRWCPSYPRSPRGPPARSPVRSPPASRSPAARWPARSPGPTLPSALSPISGGPPPGALGTWVSTHSTTDTVRMILSHATEKDLGPIQQAHDDRAERGRAIRDAAAPSRKAWSGPSATCP